ncbi:NAD(+) diphosphatase [Carnimonas nigrificans]|uniref:NAD(+) diphosphatase n=1 Tax=Carnimonas nigrificans TaxID=64323 RepID=UPI000472BCE0|nr:NAD(+) diphosphatase [Carnimonas nigrificans]
MVDQVKLERILPHARHLERARHIQVDIEGGIAPGEREGILGELRYPLPNAIALGQWRGEPVLLSMVEATHPEWPSGREWLNQLPGDAFELISTALQVNHWRRNHRFCGRCGKPTQQHRNELAMVCSNCRLRAYPRQSPCIITLVSYGRQLLLARSPRFKQGRFSTLAGFIEPGESAEQAVHREVMEEVGVEIGRVRYFKSQSWPFPHSFMLAYFAEAVSRDIHIDGVEIEAADWFEPEQLPGLPEAGAISRQLIDTFVNGVAIQD